MSEATMDDDTSAGEIEITSGSEEFDLDATESDVAEVAEPLNAELDGAVTNAVNRRIRKEVDAIADEKFSELMTPELYQQMVDVAARELEAQLAVAAADADAKLAAAEQDRPPELVFGSTAEFVREKIASSYRREVTESKDRHWCPEWWRHAEAISRLEALWRSWEHLRLDPATGMSVWWRDHADHHMSALFDPDGPFKNCTVRGGHKDTLKPLPLVEPPAEMFPDQRSSEE